MNQKIFLVGLPGAGKTTMGMELANELGKPFVDLDLEIEKNTKSDIKSIFAEQGEAYFRQLEKKHLLQIINEIPAFVLATGGGTPCFFDNMEVMKDSGTVIYINTPIDKISKRLAVDDTRPLLKKHSLSSLLSSRRRWYEQAGHTIQTYQELLLLFS